MSKSEFSRWKAQVAQWRKRYSVPYERGKYDPTQVKVANARCAKCGSYTSLTRHHKGHEYYFACLLPDVYARRYIEFRSEDCITLCVRGKRCHQRVHKLYERILAELWEYVQSCVEEITYDGHGVAHFKWKHTPSFAVLEGFRLRLISRCDQWISRGNKKMPRTYKEYKDA